MSQAPSPCTVGIDIGGTNLRAGVVSSHGEILAETSVATPQTAEGLERAICEIVGEFSRSNDVTAVGVAIAGFLDPDCEVVRFAPHLPWRDAPVRHNLQQRIGIPVRIEHDANSAAWGEFRFGAGQGAKDWVFFALGTGIGATLMVNGEIYRGAFGTAPEFGHLPVVAEGRQCPCGKKGCLERYASGTALVTTAHECAEVMRAEHPDEHAESLLAQALSGKTAEDAVRQARPEWSVPVTGKTVMDAASEGDVLGQAVLEDFSRWLGDGLSIVADVLDPELIVLGGGVSKSSHLFIDKARKRMESQIVGSGFRPQLRLATAKLGSRAGMIGVADLARVAAREN